MVEIKGGQQLENVLAALAKKLKKRGTLRVGFLEGKTYPDGTPVAMVAAIQNFGAPARGIPPRPFFSNMIREKSPRWPEALKKALEATDDNVEASLGMLGGLIAGQLRKSITETNSPPLSEVTLMLRKMKAEDPDLVVTGSVVGEAAARVRAGETSGLSGTAAKPLVDTRLMINSIDYEITMAGDAS